MSDMEPDLASQNISHFEFSGRLQMGRDRIRDVMRQGEAGPEGVLILQSSYQSDGRDHFASAVVYAVPRKPDLLSVDVTYSLSRTLEFLHEEAKPVEYLFEVLEADQLETTFRCTFVFHYGSRIWDSLMKLPLAPFNDPSMAFDEIRGFRAVKLASDGKTKYSIVVDRPENKAYHHIVTFSFVAPFDREVISAVLKEGVGISRQFVRPHDSKGAAG